MPDEKPELIEDVTISKIGNGFIVQHGMWSEEHKKLYYPTLDEALKAVPTFLS